MEIKTQIKAMDLVKKVMKGTIETSSNHIAGHEKKLQPKSRATNPLLRVRPEQVEMSSIYLLDFLQELSKCVGEHIHGICVATKGKIILEVSCSPYQIQDWHISHSLCKSITSLAIGCLVTDKKLKLSEYVVDIFDKKRGFLFGSKINKVTVEHLLTMSSGISFDELDALFEKEWVKGCLSSNVMFEPGTQFAYNSMNTYLLSAIVHERMQKGLLEYLQERLLSEMGIENLFWEKCPLGIEKGGWGLSLTMEDMIKFGILYMQKGKWSGKQLIDKTYMEQAVKKQIDTPKSVSPYGYGYQIWMCPEEWNYQFNGMFGQNVFLFPQIETVVVLTAGGEHFFPKSDIFDIVMKYFLGSKKKLEEKMKFIQGRYLEKQQSYDQTKDIDKYFFQKLNEYISSMRYNKPLHVNKEELMESYASFQKSEQRKYQSSVSREIGKLSSFLRQQIVWKKKIGSNSMLQFNREKPKESNFYQKEMTEEIVSVLNKRYVFEEKRLKIFPLFLQMMHGTYEKGIESLSIKYNGNGREEELLLELQIDDMEQKEIKIGIKKPLYDSYKIEGDCYKIGVLGEWCRNEDNRLVLKITVCFVETSHTRMIYIYFHKNFVRVRMREEPDLNALINEIPSLLNGEKKEKMTKLATTLKDFEYAKFLLQRTVEPIEDGMLKEE